MRRVIAALFRKKRRARLAGAVLLPITALLFLAGASPAPPAAPAPPSLLLITIEGLRPDFLSCYSKSASQPTPGIDRIAEKGHVFRQVVTSSVSTLPSLATLLTGSTPFQHQVWDDDYRDQLPDGVRTLAERLKAKGYMTGAFLGTSRASGRGFDRGFDVFQDGYVPLPTGTWRLALRGASKVGAGARSWLSEPAEKPFFLWMHYADLTVPEQSVLRTPDADPRIAYRDRLEMIDLDVISTLDYLKEHKRDGSLVVVLTSDHGLGLGDHGESRAGLFLYDSTLRVPLVINGPNVPKGADDSLAGLVDVVPTLQKVLGLDAVPGVAGRDLLQKQSAQPASYHAAALEGQELFGWAPREAIAQGPWRLILGATEELYDLSADPGEAKNLAASRPEQVAKLREALRALAGGKSIPEAHYRTGPVPSAASLASLQAQKLSPASLEKARARKLPDAAGFVKSLPLLQELQFVTDVMGPSPLLKAQEPLLAADGKNLFSLVGIASALGSDDEAARKRATELLKTAQGLYPLEPEIYHQLAHVAFPEKRYSDAIALLKTALELKHRYPAEVTYDLACAYARKGDKTEAVARLKESVKQGFRDVRHLKSDPDLQSIVTQPAVKTWLDAEFGASAGS
ncbi:MAG TPA: sulfatase-like hydrolase/transferase [Candidatus Polarisedimenticolia bacterium]|nr:sulfatase-like hydrolase/transferase [Candidatus Polarisedimenticolia bacterium]